MNTAVKVPNPNELDQFIEFLFDGLEGYMYVAAKVPDDPEGWDQAFFEYPGQIEAATRAIKSMAPTHEVYLAPALYKSKTSGKKENIKYTQVLWCDFDGNTPSEFDVPPSLIVRSSEPGHEHVYWKLDSPLSQVEDIDDYNRRLCYKFGADPSGWDAAQVLRPPFTINHKRSGLPVTILSSSQSDGQDLVVNLAVFDDLAPAPEKTVDYSLWEKIDLPALNDVIYRHKFGPDFKIIFEKSKEEVNDRSASLTNAAFICAEAGLNDKEIYVIISHLATRWEKFSHHTPASRARQLIGIIEHTRIKYPNTNYSDLDQVFIYTPKTLLNADIKVDWAIENMLMSNGVMMFSGPGGIGKSQIAMQFMAHLAMGEPFLHYNIEKPMKVGFMSLEMNDSEVKSFMESMYPIWAQKYPHKIHLMEENYQILPYGEAVPLNTPTGQDILVNHLETYKWDGVFIDSVGSAVMGNLNSSEAIQPFTNFNDKVRKRYGCFLWYIHHFRKPAPGQKNYGGAEDNYGDVYLFNKCTSNYTVTKTKSGLLRIRNPKQRHAPEEEPYLIRRELGLTFSYQGVETEVPDVIESITGGKDHPNNTKKDPGDDASPSPFK